MQMNQVYELQKQMNASNQFANNQFAMHAQLLGTNPQHQAILNQQHLLSQQLSQQQAPLSPILAPLKRGRKANEEGDSRKRRKKDPNRPKRAMTPYFYFTADYRNGLRREGKAVPGVKEVAQYCGPKWNSMSDEEKRPFVESAEVDRKRYLGEMNIYKKPRDEDKPKRPASAYFHFLVEFRKKMAGKPLPEHTTIPKLSGALWQKMTEEERRPYNEKMEGEKKVYEKKLADYRKMKAEEAIKSAQKKELEGPKPDLSPFAEFSRSFDSSPQSSGLSAVSQLSQYSNDLNRQIQMAQMSGGEGKSSWQSQLQNMQAAQAAQHYNTFQQHYNDIYNSPGSTDQKSEVMSSTSLPGIQSLQASMPGESGSQLSGGNQLQIHPDLQEQLKQHAAEQLAQASLDSRPQQLGAQLVHAQDALQQLSHGAHDALQQLSHDAQDALNQLSHSTGDSLPLSHEGGLLQEGLEGQLMHESPLMHPGVKEEEQ